MWSPRGLKTLSSPKHSHDSRAMDVFGGRFLDGVLTSKECPVEKVSPDGVSFAGKSNLESIFVADELSDRPDQSSKAAELNKNKKLNFKFSKRGNELKGGKFSNERKLSKIL